MTSSNRDLTHNLFFLFPIVFGIYLLCVCVCVCPRWYLPWILACMNNLAVFQQLSAYLVDTKETVHNTEHSSLQENENLVKNTSRTYACIAGKRLVRPVT